MSGGAHRGGARSHRSLSRDLALEGLTNAVGIEEFAAPARPLYGDVIPRHKIAGTSTEMSLRSVVCAANLLRMPAAPAFQAALGQAVKARREDLGLTQEQLFLRSQLHQRWISNVETGKRNPSYASLRKLAGALELSTAQLIAQAEACEAGQAKSQPA